MTDEAHSGWQQTGSHKLPPSDGDSLVILMGDISYSPTAEYTDRAVL